MSWQQLEAKAIQPYVVGAGVGGGVGWVKGEVLHAPPGGCALDWLRVG